MLRIPRTSRAVWGYFGFPTNTVRHSPCSDAYLSYINANIENLYCHNPNDNTTSTQQLGWTRKLLCTPPPPTTETQHQPLGAPDEHLLNTTKYNVTNTKTQGHNNNIYNKNKNNININKNQNNNRNSSLKECQMNFNWSHLNPINTYNNVNNNTN